MRAVTAALAAAPLVAGYQWAQTGGGRLRAGVWPPTTVNSNIGAEGEVAEPEPVVLSRPLGTPVAGRLGSLPYVNYAVTGLEYTTPSTFRLEKTAPAVVNTNGVVITCTDTGVLFGLPNPDTLGASWSTPLWQKTDAFNDPQKSRCFDVVLDNSDKVYQSVRHSVLTALTAYVYGFDSRQTTPPALSWSPAALGTDMRMIELYHISMLAGGNSVFVPTSPTLSQKGLAIVDNNGIVRTACIGTDCQSGVTGTAWVPAGQGYVAGLLSHADNAKGVAMGGFNTIGSYVAASTATFIADVDQPNPLVDPYTKYVYWIGTHGSSAQGDTPVMIYCAQGAAGSAQGTPCPGWPSNGNGVTLPSAVQYGGRSWTVEWVFAGAILPDTVNAKVARLLYTFTTSGDFNEANPTGCVMAVDPGTGAMIETYCIQRDPNGLFPITNFLATSPIVAMNARGQGAHTLVVGQYDCIFFAFDPYNLAAGPLYMADPLAPTDRATISSDFLSMTSGGTIIFQGWRDDTNTYAVIAIPGFLTLAPGGGAPSAGMSAGAKAGVAIGVLSAIGLAGAGFVYWAGGMSAALSMLGLSGFAKSLSYSGFGSSGVFSKAYTAVGSSSSSSSSSSSGATATFTSSGYGAVGSEGTSTPTAARSSYNDI